MCRKYIKIINEQAISNNLKYVLNKTIKEKELLIKELNHRVKNNLQIIVSLLNIQARISNNPQISLFIDKCETRIKSMLLIHEMLCVSEDVSKVNFKEYILESKKRDLNLRIIYGIGIMNSRSNITRNVDLPIIDFDFANLEGIYLNSSIEIESYIKFNKQVSIIMNFGYNQLDKLNSNRISNTLFQLGFLIKIKNENKFGKE